MFSSVPIMCAWAKDMLITMWVEYVFGFPFSGGFTTGESLYLGVKGNLFFDMRQDKRNLGVYLGFRPKPEFMKSPAL